jgi:D-psicose/D-tagatose/L-ribulose 3-epimerase
MNKIGIHAGYWSGLIDDNEMAKILQYTSKTGVDMVELTTRFFARLSSPERIELGKKMKECGVLPIVDVGLTPENDISSDNAEIRKKGIAYYREMIKAAVELDAKIFSGVFYSAWLRLPNKAYPDHREEKKQALAHSVRGVRQLCRMARDNGILCCAEMVNRHEQFLLNTADEGIAFAEEVGEDNLKLLLDVYHMNIDEDNISLAIRKAHKHKRLGYLHLGESNRRLPGQGASNIDWPEIGKTLKDIKYTGPLVMEPFVLYNSPVSHLVRLWRPLERPGELTEMIIAAQGAVKFIKKTLCFSR